MASTHGDSSGPPGTAELEYASLDSESRPDAVNFSIPGSDTPAVLRLDTNTALLSTRLIGGELRQMQSRIVNRAGEGGDEYLARELAQTLRTSTQMTTAGCSKHHRTSATSTETLRTATICFDANVRVPTSCK
eukprot:3421610-Amphidinium_carterae.2